MAMSAEYIATGKWYQDYLKITKYKLQNTNKSEIKNTNDQNSLKTENCKLKIESIPDGIDVNMGCPARDVVKTGAGVALMKDVRNAQNIVRSIKKKVKNIPVSVKTRLGWAKKDEILDFSRYMEDAGAKALIVHGRTYKGGFSAPVDWDMIKCVKKQLSIPVVGNGSVGMNIKERIMNYGLDGYMVGRGAIGRPWLFRKLKVESGRLKVSESLRDDYIDKQKMADIILEHGELMYKYKGKWGIREFRKHFLGYLKGLEGGKKLKKAASRAETIEDIRKICKDMV
jgi:tRNA-dihydrouridine synthase B